MPVGSTIRITGADVDEAEIRRFCAASPTPPDGLDPRADGWCEVHVDGASMGWIAPQTWTLLRARLEELRNAGRDVAFLEPSRRLMRETQPHRPLAKKKRGKSAAPAESKPATRRPRRGPSDERHEAARREPERTRSDPASAARGPVHSGIRGQDLRALVIEHDPAVRETLLRAFAARSVRAIGLDRVDRVHAMIRREPPHVIVVDVDLPRLGGIDLLREIRRRTEGPPILGVLVSPRASVEAREREGVDLSFGKPLDARAIVEAAIERCRVDSSEAGER